MTRSIATRISRHGTIVPLAFVLTSSCRQQSREPASAIQLSPIGATSPNSKQGVRRANITLTVSARVALGGGRGRYCRNLTRTRDAHSYATVRLPCSECHVQLPALSAYGSGQIARDDLRTPPGRPLYASITGKLRCSSTKLPLVKESPKA
jgi:hypothetical protein